MKILRRYLLGQHVLPFLFALSAITSFELLRQIARRLGDLLGKGLPWTVILEFFVLTLPYLIAITVSMSVLVAVLYTVSRLAGDHELTAMRAGGVSIGQILRPLLAASVVVAAASFLFGDQVLPRTNHRLRSLQTDIFRTKPTFSLKEHVVNEIQRGRLSLRTAHIDQATYRMRDVAVYSLEEARRQRIIYADSGRLAFAPNQEDLQLTLYDGTTQEFDRDDPRMFQLTAFEEQVSVIRGVASEFVRRETDEYRSDREMGVCQLEGVVGSARREAVLSRVRARTAQLNGLRSLVGLPDVEPDTAGIPDPQPSLYCQALAGIRDWFRPKPLEAQVVPRRAPDQQNSPPMPRRFQQQDTRNDSLMARFNNPGRQAYVTGTLARNRTSEIRVMYDAARAAKVRQAVYDVELQKKFSIPAACIVFVLVGVPLAIRFPKGGVGLVIGAGMVVFSVYYVGLIAGESLANRLILPPFVAMWLANIVMSLVGIVGLWWVHRAGTVPRLRRRASAGGGRPSPIQQT